MPRKIKNDCTSNLELKTCQNLKLKSRLCGRMGSGISLDWNTKRIDIFELTFRGFLISWSCVVPAARILHLFCHLESGVFQANLALIACPRCTRFYSVNTEVFLDHVPFDSTCLGKVPGTWIPAHHCETAGYESNQSST